jgi:hypothetical protein
MNLFQFVFSEEGIIYWNPSNKFGGNIYKSNNIEVVYKEKMPIYYTISPNKIKVDTMTDLYLSFDNPLSDSINNYKIIYKKYHVSENKSIYKKSAYFISMDEKIELSGNESSFFQSGINLGSFTISFWVYPTNFANNEIILKIGSQYYEKSSDMVEDQSIKAKILNGKLVWEFANIFISNNKKLDLIKLESFSRLIPEKWSNIVLTYDSYKGIITSYINNNEEGVALVSDTNDIDGNIYNMRFNSQNRCIINIAPNFYGAIDEFCIKVDSRLENADKYNPQGGEITSKVIDFGKSGIHINKILCEDYKENQSDIIYYYRYSNAPFDKDDIFSSNIKWYKLVSNSSLNKRIRFFQWKAILLAGRDNNYSPRLKGINIYYNHNNPPSIPAGVKAIANDGTIDIKWIANTEKDIKGYKIYYGLKSGSYFGTDASEGSSPIDVGLVNRFRITGLNKKQLYYICVTAYDDDEHTHESDFSEEIIVRPLDQ